MNETNTTLTEEDLLKIHDEVRKMTHEMSKANLENLINKMVDRVLADPGNPILKQKAAKIAEVWNRRYSRNE
jgi:hypothetical protein